MLSTVKSFVSLRETQTPLSYETFQLRVEAVADHWRINGSWQGKKASEIVAVPIAPDRLKELRTRDLDAKWGQEAFALPQKIESLSELGETLFRHVLSASLSALYDEARTDALRRGRALRLEFAMAGDGSLWSVPWELLHDGVRFLALADDLSITRRIVGPRRTPCVGPEAKPLRILMTVSSPRTLSAINQSARISALQAAVTPLVLNGSLQLDVVPDGCVKTLRRFLVVARRQGRPYDVWHFAGHGTVDDLGRGRLAMTSQNGSVHWMGGAEMASLFAESSQIRLAVLNACRGAEGDLQKRWPSPAAALILCGIPAVVAMQLEISYDASLAFDRELYAHLVDEASIDEAVIAARRAILDLPNHVEWLRPVLLTGGEEAALVDFRP